MSVLGSTGSVGTSALDLIEKSGGSFAIEALTAWRNVDLLAEQAIRHGARAAVIADPGLYGDLKSALAGTGIEAAAGADALVDAALRPADVVLAAIMGSAGLASTLAAARQGGVVALANKETLVCAGEIVLAQARASGATVLPVDSEHSAIFQVLDATRPETVEKIVLTASGGPFRATALEDLAAVTPEQAVAHPNWEMGRKISVDSATMMNKGLELIEAHHLFAMEPSRIEILVHPQSVVHSMVSYVDGSVLAQLGSPDMRTPIAYALAWPSRMAAPVERLDLAKIGQLTFEAPDEERFPALRLARQALLAGGAAPAVLNAANEIAVAAFLERRLEFLEISGLVDRCLDAFSHSACNDLESLLELDQSVRSFASEIVADYLQ